MKEKENLRDEQQDLNKKIWEAPKLISLDKGKTEGGSFTGEPEGTNYVGTQTS